jgi:hypothetical protein
MGLYVDSGSIYETQQLTGKQLPACLAAAASAAEAAAAANIIGSSAAGAEAAVE